jgi:mitochondrial GTPase 1
MVNEHHTPQPFRQAMATKFPGQRVFFASCKQPRHIKALNELLVSMSSSRFSLSFFYPLEIFSSHGNQHAHLASADIAKSHALAAETNVLVIGMPNVGKSTLLNALRNLGIPGREQFFHSSLSS